MFDKNTLYALNKREPEAIVYIDAYGKITRLTVDDFSSVKEFRKWKNWMKMKSHSDEKKDHVYRNHTESIENIPEDLCATPDRETEILTQICHEEREYWGQCLRYALENVLTENQRIRLRLHYVEGLSIREISRQLNLDYKTVHESIDGAKKKIKKYFEKHPTKP